MGLYGGYYMTNMTLGLTCRRINYASIFLLKKIANHKFTIIIHMLLLVDPLIKMQLYDQ